MALSLQKSLRIANFALILAVITGCVTPGPAEFGRNYNHYEMMVSDAVYYLHLQGNSHVSRKYLAKEIPKRAAVICEDYNIVEENAYGSSAIFLPLPEKPRAEATIFCGPIEDLSFARISPLSDFERYHAALEASARGLPTPGRKDLALVLEQGEVYSHAREVELGLGHPSAQKQAAFPIMPPMDPQAYALNSRSRSQIQNFERLVAKGNFEVESCTVGAVTGSDQQHCANLQKYWRDNIEKDYAALKLQNPDYVTPDYKQLWQRYGYKNPSEFGGMIPGTQVESQPPAYRDGMHAELYRGGASERYETSQQYDVAAGPTTTPINGDTGRPCLEVKSLDPEKITSYGEEYSEICDGRDCYDWKYPVEFTNTCTSRIYIKWRWPNSRWPSFHGSNLGPGKTIRRSCRKVHGQCDGVVEAGARFAR